MTGPRSAGTFASWAFNYVTNLATLNYNAMIGDIRARQQAIEQRQFADQVFFEATEQKFYDSEGEAAARAYLTGSVQPMPGRTYRTGGNSQTPSS